MFAIQVVGLGCPRCTKLARRAEIAAKQLGTAYSLEKVRDLRRVVEIGVPVPALLVNGTVCAAGTIPPVAAIRDMLSQVASAAATVPAGEDSPLRRMVAVLAVSEQGEGGCS